MHFPADSVPHAVQSLAQRTIISCLQLIPGGKDLVIESDLISPLDLVCGVALLRNAGVDKIYKLEPGSCTPGRSKNCCFLARNTVSSIRTIVELITADETASSLSHDYHLLCVPRMTTVCEKVLEEGGVYGQLKIMQCPILMFPLDVDVISLERNVFFTHVFLEREKTVLQDVAYSLVQLQELLGCIPHVHIVGSVSKDIATFTKCLMRTESSISNKLKSHISDLLLMDRDIDMVSVLASQLTYEGVLDEAFAIECGKVFMPKEVIPPKGGKHVVDSRDAVFAGIRDLHLSSALVKLKETGASLKQMHSSRQGMNLSDIKEFVVTQMKDLQTQYKSLNIHISACEAIMKEKKELLFAEQLQTERNMIDVRELKEAADFLESFIVRQVNPQTALRLLCLLSLVQDGLPGKQYRQWCRLFAQSFGHEHVVTFSNLRKLRLLYENMQISLTAPDASAKKVRFREVCKRLNLIPRLPDGSTYNVKNPEDCAFVFGGAYSPVVAALLDSCVLNHFDACTKKDLCAMLPECRFESWRSSVGAGVCRDEDEAKKLVAVFFVGGVTFAEISAVRFWARTRRVQVLVFTTGIVNGNSLMQSLMPVK